MIAEFGAECLDVLLIDPQAGRRRMASVLDQVLAARGQRLVQVDTRRGACRSGADRPAELIRAIMITGR